MRIENVGKGINTDAMPEELELGVWSSAQNMRFRNGFAERFRGMRSVFTAPLEAPYAISPYTTATDRFWVNAGLTKIWVDDGTTQTDITATPFTATIDGKWSLGSLNGVFTANNPANIPVYWGGDVLTDVATLPGWDATHRARVVRSFKNFLIALDVTKGSTRYPNMFKWSFAAVPGAIPSGWDPSDATQDAGERDLAETPDLMVDALPLGDLLIIYKERSMYAAQQSFDRNIFRTFRLPGEEGMLTVGCAAMTPNGHVVLTAGDVIIHNGQGPKSIANGRVRQKIFDTMSRDFWQRSFVVANVPMNEVWVCYPLLGAETCNFAAVWNWIDDTWAFRSLAHVTAGASGQVPSSINLDRWIDQTQSWAEQTNNWIEGSYADNQARTILSSTSGDQLVDQGSTDLDMTIPARLERTGMHFDSPETYKLLRSLRIMLDAQPGTQISVQFGAAANPDDQPTWEAPVIYTQGTSIKADSFASGRYLALRLSSSANNGWRTRSLTPEIAAQGMF